MAGQTMGPFRYFNVRYRPAGAQQGGNVRLEDEMYDAMLQVLGSRSQNAFIDEAVRIGRGRGIHNRTAAVRLHILRETRRHTVSALDGDDEVRKDERKRLVGIMSNSIGELVKEDPAELGVFMTAIGLLKSACWDSMMMDRHATAQASVEGE